MIVKNAAGYDFKLSLGYTVAIQISETKTSSRMYNWKHCGRAEKQLSEKSPPPSAKEPQHRTGLCNCESSSNVSQSVFRFVAKKCMHPAPAGGILSSVPDRAPSHCCTQYPNSMDIHLQFLVKLIDTVRETSGRLL